jgi:hypothetical protein
MWIRASAVAEDMLAVLKLANESRRYPGVWASNQKSSRSGGYGAGSYTVDDDFDLPITYNA